MIKKIHKNQTIVKLKFDGNKNDNNIDNINNINNNNENNNNNNKEEENNPSETKDFLVQKPSK